jgi:hypothetical protein
MIWPKTKAENIPSHGLTLDGFSTLEKSSSFPLSESHDGPLSLFFDLRVPLKQKKKNIFPGL